MGEAVGVTDAVGVADAESLTSGVAVTLGSPDEGPADDDLDGDLDGGADVSAGVSDALPDLDGDGDFVGGSGDATEDDSTVGSLVDSLGDASGVGDSAAVVEPLGEGVAVWDAGLLNERVGLGRETVGDRVGEGRLTEPSAPHDVTRAVIPSASAEPASSRVVVDRTVIVVSPKPFAEGGPESRTPCADRGTCYRGAGTQVRDSVLERPTHLVEHDGPARGTVSSKPMSPGTNDARTRRERGDASARTSEVAQGNDTRRHVILDARPAERQSGDAVVVNRGGTACPS